MMYEADSLGIPRATGWSLAGDSWCVLGDTVQGFMCEYGLEKIVGVCSRVVFKGS